MIWPSDGGMDLSTIHSMGDLSGQIVVSRASKTSGKTLAIGGSEVTNSMRSVPSSSSSAVCGTMNVDKYKSICDALNTSDPNGALKALGYKDDICKSLIDDYNSYFGRTEINDIAGIIDNNVDVGYGFVGEAKEWIVGDVTMVGGAQQIDSVFSWDTMVKADIISNPHAITIGF